MPVLAPHMREALAQIAFDLFSERGINGVSLDAIAAKAGVTKGSLYWHYKSKKELVLAAAGIYYREWHQMINAELASVPDPLERFRRCWQLSITMCLFNKPKRMFSTELFALGLHDREIQASWAQFYDSVRELFVGAIQAACHAGALRVDDPRRAADWLLATFEGIKHRASFQPQICTPAERDAIVDGFMRTLLAQSEKAPTPAPGPRRTKERSRKMTAASSSPS